MELDTNAATKTKASRTAPPSEAEAAKEDARMFGVLSKQKKVRLMLPRTEGKGEQAPQIVFLNGVGYSIPRGISVDVPESIAVVLANAGMV